MQASQDKRSLLKPLTLPKPTVTAKEPLPPAKQLPTKPITTGLPPKEFPVQASTAGQAQGPKKKRRKTAATDVTTHVTTPASTQAPSQGQMTWPQMPQYQPSASTSAQGPPWWQFLPGPSTAAQGAPVWPQWPMMPGPWYPQQQQQGWAPVSVPPTTTTKTHASTTASAARQRALRQRKAEAEDRARAEQGLSPKKRYQSDGPKTYNCGRCQKEKIAKTGHTQESGQWYCPLMGSLEEWRKTVKPRKKRQPKKKIVKDSDPSEVEDKGSDPSEDDEA